MIFLDTERQMLVIKSDANDNVQWLCDYEDSGLICDRKLVNDDEIVGLAFFLKVDVNVLEAVLKEVNSSTNIEQLKHYFS